MNDEIREEIRQNLIKYRKQKGLNQKEIADLLNVNQSAVSMWETGRSSIDIINIYNICKLLDISINELFGKYSNEIKDYKEETLKFQNTFNKMNKTGKKILLNSLDFFENIEELKENI